MKNVINYELINKLYMEWVNEQDPFIQRKIKEDIKTKISQYDFLMYSIRFAMPFEAFRDIFSLADLFRTLEDIEEKGEDITNITNNILLIQGIEDIQTLNKFSKTPMVTKIENFKLRFEGGSLFEFGDIINIGQKFPYACVNHLDIKTVEKMCKKEKDYKGIQVIITIDNMGELPLDKLSDIEKKFDVTGIRIIEKDRSTRIEQRAISLKNYKQIRAIIDNEIINKLYVTEGVSKMSIDCQLATQVFYLIVDKIKYDKEFKAKSTQMSIDDWVNYYCDVSNNIGLITGKTICGGYSEILRNVLSCINIKSKTMVGKAESGTGHAWNQIQLGDIWFNADVTWASEQILEGEPSGDLFMSDAVFFGNRRDGIFDQGRYQNGESMETKSTIGGHSRVFNTHSEKCECCLPPYVTTALIRKAREYEENYKKYGKDSNYTGAVPYVGSNIEQMRSSVANLEEHMDSARL